MADERILDVIAKFSASGETGTVMAVFNDNSLGRFYVAGGMLATARYKSREGNAALQAAMEVAVKTAKFHDNSDLVRSGDLIDNVAMPQVVSATAPKANSPSGPVVVQTGNGPRLTHVMRAGIMELLAEFIGPVAPLVMSDLPDVIDVDSAIDHLSQEITDAKEAADFVRQARVIASA